MSIVKLVSPLPDGTTDESPRHGPGEPSHKAKSKGNINPGILTPDEWFNLPPDKTEPILGSPQHQIVRPFTKSLVVAGEKEFKTTLTSQLTLSISCGVTLCSQLPVPRPRKVLYLHGELSPPEIRERLYQASFGLPKPLPHFRAGRDPGVHLCHPEGQKQLRELLQKFEPEVLALDSWQTFIPGVDENAFKEVSLATSFLDSLIDDFGVTLFIDVHQGKDRGRGARGHSLLAGWRDTLFKLERHTYNGPNGVCHTLRVSVDPRWDKPIPPFVLEFDPATRTLRPSTKLFFSKQTTQILNFLYSQKGNAPKKAVGAALGLKGEALRKAIERAVKAGAVKVDGDQVIAQQPALQGTGCPTPFVQV